MTRAVAGLACVGMVLALVGVTILIIAIGLVALVRELKVVLDS